MGIETKPLLPLAFEVLKAIEAADLHENALDAICAALKLGRGWRTVLSGSIFLTFWLNLRFPSDIEYTLSCRERVLLPCTCFELSAVWCIILTVVMVLSP